MADPSELEFLRRLNADVFEWYKLADSKAQFLLALDGVFITVLGSVLLGANAGTAGGINLTSSDIVFASVVAIGVISSIGCALACLFSRMRNARIGSLLRGFGVDVADISTYSPRVAWWFGMIAVLEPTLAVEYLRRADGPFESEALAQQIVILSKNVLHKHRWVNRGWVATGVGLVALLCAFASHFVTSLR